MNRTAEPARDDKTGEMHLSSIFAELGVSSRTETAAAVIRSEQA